MITSEQVKELRDKSGAGMLDCKHALDATNGDIDAAIDWLREKGISKAAKKADRIAAEGLAAILIKDNEAVIVEVNAETDFVAQNKEFTDLVALVLETIMEHDPKDMNEALALKTVDGSLNESIINKTAKIGEKLSFRRFTKLTKASNQIFGSYIHMGGKIAVLNILEGDNLEVAKDVAMQAAAMRPLYTFESDVPATILDNEKAVMREELINEGKPENRIDNILIGKVKKYYEEVCLEDQIFVKGSDNETVKQYVTKNNSKIITSIRYEVGEGIEKRQDDFASEVAKQINDTK